MTSLLDTRGLEPGEREPSLEEWEGEEGKEGEEGAEEREPRPREARRREGVKVKGLLFTETLDFLLTASIRVQASRELRSPPTFNASLDSSED